MMSVPETVRYQPQVRPAIAVLQILDDSQMSAESFRIRADRVVIGRTTGDVNIGHDVQMSSSHAEIVRTNTDGRYSWELRDLNSANGVFVKINRAQLHHDTELILGARQRYRMCLQSSQSASETAQGPARQTVGWDVPPTGDGDGAAVLLKLRGPNEAPHRLPLTEQNMWIGTDSTECSICIPDDATLNKHHACISQVDGTWIIEDANTLNGTWVRMPEVNIETDMAFMLGEQRFILKVSV